MYQNEMKEGFIEDYMRSRVVARTSLYSLFRKVEPFIDDNNRLGLSINGEAIYIKKNEICNFGAIDNMYYFADKLTRIELQTT